MVALLGGAVYAGIAALGNYVQPQPREITVNISPDKFVREPVALAARRMARPKASNDQSLIELFLDMLAAERGASVNTLDAYRRDLEDFSA